MGKELYFDGTRVEANADIDKRIPRFYWQAQQHLASLFVEDSAVKARERGRPFVEKYGEQRLAGHNTNTTQPRQADTHVCPTDPDATPLYSQPGHSRLGYNLHYVVDGGKSRIILAALVTPGSIQDQTPMLDLQRWSRFRWGIQPKLAVADKKYGSLANIVGLENDGICAYLAMPDHRHRKNYFSDEDFQYVTELDHYICPAGERLPRSTYDRQRDVFMYRTSRKICQDCHLKAQCTNSSYARVVTRSPHHHYIERVQNYHKTTAYEKAQRKRSVWVCPRPIKLSQWK